MLVTIGIPETVDDFFFRSFSKRSMKSNVQTCSLDHSCTGPFCQLCDRRSLEKLVLDPDKSTTRLGEYPGDVEPDDILDGDGGPVVCWDCCCHGTVPGGDSDCGIIFLTKMKFNV